VNEFAPSLVTFVDNFSGILLIFGLSRECKSIFGLAVGNLVDPEPFVGCPDQSRKMSLNILDIVEFRRQGVVYVNNYDFPVGLAFINESHDPEDLDLFDLANITNLLANLADIERVVVSPGFSLCMQRRGILPGLGESAIIPDVPVVREAVTDIAKLASLDVLFDGVEGLFLGDFHLGIGPSRNLDDHVEDAILLISVERNVMERRDH